MVHFRGYIPTYLEYKCVYYGHFGAICKSLAALVSEIWDFCDFFTYFSGALSSELLRDI